MPLTLVRAFDVTIPAGTLKTAPLVTLTQFEPSVVDHIDWLFPAGCAGLVGIQIGARSVPVIPDGVGSFTTRSGSSAGYDLSDHHTTGDWSVIGYNLGTFPHTIHVEFKIHRHQRTERDLFILGDVSQLLTLGES